MSLYISNPEAKRLADELAARTGETLTMAVIAAIRERLAHVPRTKREIDQRRTRLRKIVEAGQAARRRGEVGSKTDDDLYDDRGLPV